MYTPLNHQWVKCDEHGRRVPAVVHLFVEAGDLDNPEHGWTVCRHCAERMDRDSCFKESKRRAFEEFQRELQYFLRSKSFVDNEDCL